MSLSIQRLESLALRELSLILRKDAKNHYLSNLTVTEVRITNDLSYMTIYYTFYSGKVENYEKALQDCKGYLRSELAKKLKARKMPELLFKHDEALEYGNHISDLIAQLHQKKNNKKRIRQSYSIF